jgi:serine/threonine protein kinase
MSRFQLPTEIPPGGVMLEGTHYRLLAVLGSGGQGIAYKVANLQEGGRLEVLKILLNVNERELVARFLREKNLLAKVDHKSIVGMLHSFWLPDGRPAFTMPYIPGQSLKQLLKGGNHLSVRQAVSIASDVADGLAAAHAMGFVHRDIKPANIIVGYDGSVKIIDFGVAKVLQVDPNSPEEKLTINPSLIGTMVYASPEMLWRFVATPESDLYSLGLVLYEMLTGRRPFHAKSVVELAELVRTTAPPSLAAAGQGGPFPDQLDLIVRSLLKSNVEERTRTARAVRRQLEDIKRVLPSDAQIEVNADAGADDVTVSSTAVGTYPDAIAATGPGHAPILRVSSPSYPSSVSTAAGPVPVHDDGTVRSHAFGGPAATPESDQFETFRETPHAIASVPRERAAKSLVPLVLIVGLLFLGGVGALAGLLSMRSPHTKEAQSSPAPTSVVPPIASTVAPSVNTAAMAPGSSDGPATPAPTTTVPSIAAAAPPTAKKPAGAPSGAAKPVVSQPATQPPVAAPPSIAPPLPPPTATATPTPPPPKPPPPGGAMDDRL